MKNSWIIVGVIALVLIGGSVWYSNSVVEKANEGVEVMQHIAGNPDAEVVLVEYADFQCPACAQFNPELKKVIEAYGDHFRFEYKHFPLTRIHPLAIPAAKASEAAGQQGKFSEYVDMLFTKQSEWTRTANANGAFLQYAEELDLDIGKFRTHMRSSILEDNIKDQMNEALEKGFTGTPTFTLNGERMNITTYQDFRDQIVAAIEATGVVIDEGSDAIDANSTETE